MVACRLRNEAFSRMRQFSAERLSRRGVGKRNLFCNCVFSGSVVKNLPANAGDAGLIPESGRSLEKEMAILSSILAWEIPWTEEPGGL